MSPQIVDLRSDTVTKPTAGMRAAMAAAEVGDDVYGEDPTVNDLQAYVADLFGHEAALYAPSGSMANQIALQLSVPPGSELLCDGDAHVVTYEIGAAAAIGGISTRTWPACGPDIDVDLVASLVRREGFGVPTRAIAVEQTHNQGGGGVIPFETLQRLRIIANDAGIGVHCDGARIWHAHVADGVALRSYGELFDTMSVCLSKGLGAPVGSLVIGSAEKIARARTLRKRMGGAMRQVGVLAAAGRYALDHHIDRLADDHARARRLAEAFAPLGLVDPARVRTNVVMLDMTKHSLDARGVVAAAKAEGVRVTAMAPRLVRIVTHLDLDDAAIDRAIEVLTPILSR
ncbi:MAG TPA: GntG family PLP-dependent aldolase [Micromonosporaceae bacterium]|nr:GntG family PLP-dependent aldolase [Micromonosporaceae bacterium]